MKDQLTQYELSRDFFNFCYDNPDMVKPNDIALYFFIIEHYNRLGKKDKFRLPSSMAMEAISIKSSNTYHKSLSNLVNWGFVKMVEKSKNQWSSCIVAVLKFKSARKSALDTALIQHGSRHEYGSDCINKQYNNITNKQERETHAQEKSDFISMEELEEYMTGSKWFVEFSKNTDTPQSELIKIIKEYKKHLQNGNVTHKDKTDLFIHFRDWHGKRFNKQGAGQYKNTGGTETTTKPLRKITSAL